MKKQKSQTDSLIPSFLFAVYPFSISFSESQNDQFFLYFQKNVQILNKFKLPQKEFLPNKLAYFTPPPTVQSFRILSQRNLSYKWSLYHLVGSNEEHIDSENFDLSPFWKEFITNKQDIKPYEVVFKKTKCRLFCLVGVGTVKSIQLNFTQYFQMANSDTIKRPRLLQPHLQNQLSLNSNLAQQNSAMSKKKQKIKEDFKVFSKEGQSQELSEFSLPQIKLQSKDSNANKALSSPPPLMAKTSSHIVDDKKRSQQKPIRLGSKIGNLSYLSIDEANEAAESGNVESYSSKQKLSPQQAEIGKQIESKIKEQQQFSQIHSNSKLLSLHRGPSSGDQMLKLYCLRKASKLTDSQRLNEKGQIVVTPFYYHYKYYVIIISILIIFVGLILHNPQSKPINDSHVDIKHLHNQHKKKGGHSSITVKHKK